MFSLDKFLIFISDTMGKFFIKNSAPYFSPEDGFEYEIKTSKNSGLEIRVESKPVSLDPDIYYIFGTVVERVTISRLNSFTKTHVESYSGEFTIGSNGSVVFPSSVRWVGGKPEFSEEGATYQFSIVNGIGKYYKV